MIGRLAFLEADGQSELFEISVELCIAVRTRLMRHEVCQSICDRIQFVLSMACCTQRHGSSAAVTRTLKRYGGSGFFAEPLLLDPSCSATVTRLPRLTDALVGCGIGCGCGASSEPLRR